MRFGSGGARSRWAERFERRLQAAASRSEDATPVEPAEVALPARLPALSASNQCGERPWPDLLNPVPHVAVDEAALRAALGFSFIAEDDNGAIESALEQAPIAASSFDPECFFRELYVDQLRAQCMQDQHEGRPIEVHYGYVLRVLSQPPSDRAVTLHRQALWRALLDDTELRRATYEAQRALSQLLALLRGIAQVGIRGEQARRRLEILKALHLVFERLSAPALTDTPGTLARVARFAAHVKCTPAHARLSDLLHYERERAHAQLSVQLSADGTVRELHLHALHENSQSQFHTPLLLRWLGRIWLSLKGYRITEGEVLDRWLDQIFEGLLEFLPALVQLSGDLDVLLSGLALVETCRAHAMPVCFPELVEAGEPEHLEALYNPLLFALGVRPVPSTLTLDAARTATLVTGPNSGGKTRLLQALGILQLCAQAGMPVPATRARLRCVPGIFASLTQPSGADQVEGRLGTELMRIRMLFERAELGSLLLIDELCSGTSPSEGEELFRMVLELLVELAPTAFVSTHFLSVAADLASTQVSGELGFLQVELDADERPTHRFIHGVAVTSLARRTAQRLGVTRDELKALASQKRRPAAQ
jgi:DNA mismatch repair protein MutS2